MGNPVLLNYYGGKNLLAPWIIEHLPMHRGYVEPFGGSAAVLLNKSPVDCETYNDIDGRLVNVFRVLRDPAGFRRLRRMVHYTPYSREQRAECRELLVGGAEDPVVAAWAYIVCSRQGFSGNVDATSWGYSTGFEGRPAPAWGKASRQLGAFHRRLREVQIDHVDWRICLDRYRGEDWLAYCDPPYLHRARAGVDRYRHELTDDDHAELIERLLAYPGMVALSAYSDAMYDALAESGWDRRERKTIAWGAAKTAATGCKGPGGLLGQERVEVLWRNPAAIAKLAQPELF